MGPGLIHAQWAESANIKRDLLLAFPKGAARNGSNELFKELLDEQLHGVGPADRKIVHFHSR